MSIQSLTSEIWMVYPVFYLPLLIFPYLIKSQSPLIVPLSYPSSLSIQVYDVIIAWMTATTPGWSLRLQFCSSPVHSPLSSSFIQTIFLSIIVMLLPPILTCPWVHVLPCIHQVSAQIPSASLKYLLLPPQPQGGIPPLPPPAPSPGASHSTRHTQHH